MNSHSAAGPALGYLYQTQWPLVALLRRARLEPDCELALEMADDVTWMSDGRPKELIQTKHHVSRNASLTDHSTDVWRTITVWLDSGPPASPSAPSLVLVTTAVPTANSAVAKLGPVTRDVAGAVQLFTAAASASTAATTADARLRFLSLSEADKVALLSRVTVLGGAPHIADLDTELRQELHWALPAGHEDLFVGLVWDWWFRQAVRLLDRSLRGVGGLAVRAAIDDLRDQFTHSNLPSLAPRDEFATATASEYSERTFVRQLDLVRPPPIILETAVQDYLRAYSQSARWIENNLVGMVEIERFEADLRDEWEREFAWMTSRLPTAATDDDRIAAGRELLHKCLDTTRIQFRENYREPYFVRGKLHQLADQGRAGWHPDYETMLADLLMGAAP